MEAKEREAPELVRKIKESGELTDCWNLIIDADRWGEVRQMEIDEMISFFRKKNIYQWNEWIQYTGKRMSIRERDHILDLIERFYKTVFLKDESILKPHLISILQEERKKCENKGIWSWCKTIHPRLKVEENDIVYMKNREFRYHKKEIRKINITASMFVYPHLWLYEHDGELDIVKAVLAERSQNEIPKDFVRIFQAMGNETRLQIIHCLLKGICTTQALAQTMSLSEAAVSKHLKIMWEAGILRKTKEGFYVKYEFKTEVIDFIPYTFYETMM